MAYVSVAVGRQHEGCVCVDMVLSCWLRKSLEHMVVKAVIMCCLFLWKGLCECCGLLKEGIGFHPPCYLMSLMMSECLQWHMCREVIVYSSHWCSNNCHWCECSVMCAQHFMNTNWSRSWIVSGNYVLHPYWTRGSKRCVQEWISYVLNCDQCTICVLLSIVHFLYWSRNRNAVW
jgi:hypothetical protein